MSEISIRRATPADAAVVADFNVRLARETEEHDLDEAAIGPGVRTALSDATKCLYFVAESGGRVVGQTMVTFEWSDWRNGDIWWLQSVYVDPAFRGRGVFRALHGAVEQAAREAGSIGLRLYVWNQNARAQATYAKLGWTDGNYKVMERMFDARRGEGRS